MYIPDPVDLSDVILPLEFDELTEEIAKNVHDVWAAGRIKEGWKYGEKIDSEQKTTPCLVSYEDLPESEKDYDRNTALNTLKLIVSLGYSIEKKKTFGQNSFNQYELETLCTLLNMLMDYLIEGKDIDEIATYVKNNITLFSLRMLKTELEKITSSRKPIAPAPMSSPMKVQTQMPPTPLGSPMMNQIKVPPTPLGSPMMNQMQVPCNHDEMVRLAQKQSKVETRFESVSINVPNVYPKAETSEKKKKRSLLSGLFQKKETKPSQPKPLEISKAQFSATAPKEMVKGENSMINVYMYEEAYRHIVDEAIANSNAALSEIRAGVYKVEEGAKVRVNLSSPDIDIIDNEDIHEWNGGYLNFGFRVSVPKDYAKQSIFFIANVYINDLIATKIKFEAKCFSHVEQKMRVTREDVLSAFISYASQDRNQVATIIQGMKKSRPDMEIFFDVENLRSGENWKDKLQLEIEKKDVLYLCWSTAASKSEWVDFEWRYALKLKGEECIEPVPLEPPAVCPPPEELKQKHFNDLLLYVK